MLWVDVNVNRISKVKCHNKKQNNDIESEQHLLMPVSNVDTNFKNCSQKINLKTKFEDKSVQLTLRGYGVMKWAKNCII